MKPATAERTDVFEGVFRDLWPEAVRLAHLLTGSWAVGEEIAQEAFVGLLRRGGEVDQPRAYLRRSVVNLAINAGRRATRERLHLAGLRLDPVLPPELDETWQLLAGLPPRQRAVVVLRYYADLSEAQIAEALGCRPGTVKSTAARALARLREELS